MATNNSVNVGLSGSTGSGNFVGANTPTLITPLLGTPTSGTLTNCTGLPAANVTMSWQTYSPTIGDGTNDFTGLTSVGNYVVMGSMTYFSAWIQWTGLGSGSGNLKISLPSTTNSASARYPFAVGISNGIGLVVQVDVTASADSNVNYAWVFRNAVGTGGIMQVSQCATAGEVQIGGWYRT